MPTEDELRNARELHIAGKLNEAEPIYRRLLERSADNAEALYLMGCLLVQSGRQAEGVPLLRKAALLVPQAAEPQIALGEAFSQTARWSEAVEALTRALEIRPDLAPVRIHLGIALYGSGQEAAAVSLFRQMLDSEPGNIEAGANLAHVLNEMGRFAEAEPHARHAASLAPDDARVLDILAVCLCGIEKFGEAEIVYRHMLTRDPDNPAIYLCLFNAVRKQERHVEAEQVARRALELAPNDVLALDAVGAALVGLDRLEEAVSYFDRAVRLRPDYADAVYHLAHTCARVGKYEEAVRYGVRLLELRPTAQARYELAMEQIRTGRYIEGWKNHEAHEEITPGRKVPPEFPRWNGLPIEGRTLLVLSDGGVGDAIMFARFLRPACDRARATVYFECRPELMDLLADAVAPVRVLPGPIEPSNPPVPYDFLAIDLNLPSLLGTTEETVPSGLLQMSVSEEERAGWRQRLEGLSGLKVGLSWAGNPIYLGDPERSMRLETFAPLADVDGLNLVSLQVGPPAEQIHSDRHGLQMLHVPEELSPWMKTAALMRELDLVISVDTATAHLAGALGVETWLLLPFMSHWIWNAYRQDDTRWYPKHRLFRQHRRRDWDSVIDRVRQELLDRIAGVRSVRSTFGQDGQDGQDEHKRS